jgi:Tol biopolymer transport system component
MRTVTAVAVMFLLVATVSTQPQRPQDVELQAAIRTATVDGDLEKAAKLFAAIADTYKTDRATAATALLHLADVYQKRGDAQARAVYQRIVTDFGDQKDAVAAARRALGGAGMRTGGLSYTRVWPASGMAGDIDLNGTISPDGRQLSYLDWSSGGLMLRDLASGTDRRLTGTGKWPSTGEYAEESAISRDGTRIAYAWYAGKNRYQLRLGDLKSTPVQPTTVLDNPDIDWVAPHDWSPDGRSIVAVLTRRTRRTEIALIALADGSVRTLAFTDWRGASKASLSPDGRWLAFDRAMGKPADDERDIFIVAVDTGQERAAVAGPGLERLVGWSPDGTQLLFASDRNGILSLWTQPIRDGSPHQNASLLKADIGSKVLGISSDGDLFVAQQVAGRNIYIAEVDFATGRMLKPATRAVDRFVGMNEWPDWSRDGKFLSYVYARNWVGRSPSLAIRSMEDGRVREIPLDVINGRAPFWTPDGQAFVTHGVDAEGRAGVYRIGATDGAVTPLVHASPNQWLAFPEMSADGRKVYFSRVVESVGSVVELDLESGRQRELITGAGPGVPAPDGRSIATLRRRSPDGPAIVVISLADGSQREVLRVAPPQVLMQNLSWAPDSRSLIVNTFWNDGDKRQTWLVSVEDGTHKVLDLPGHTWSRVRVHPDGKRIAYHAGELRSEVWVLQNFLPGR